MADINITPAGNQLFEVDIETRNRARTIEVAVPDGFMSRIEVDDDVDLSMQDVVQASVEFALEREGVDGVDGRLSLGEYAEQWPGFTESVGRRIAG